MLPGRTCFSPATTVVQDALDEIARQRPKDLFKPLRVHFIGEEGIDAGGVKKEFFQLLVAELLCPDYGMLIQNPVRTRRSWSSAALTFALSITHLLHGVSVMHVSTGPP